MEKKFILLEKLSQRIKMFKPVLIVPYYNHLKEFESFAPQLANLKKDVIFINDGSEKEQTEQVKKICQQYHFFYIEHPVNQGKGAAVKTGIKTAFKQGYTHALQIDSDGQHNINDVDLFLSVAQKNQQSIVNGSPVYDDTAPKSRLIGRKITNFWVAVETGSKKKIADAMCGFRVYPAKAVAESVSVASFERFYNESAVAGVVLIEESLDRRSFNFYHSIVLLTLIKFFV